MNTHDIIEELCRKHGINKTKVEKDLSLGQGTIGKWKKSSPKTTTLEKVANYFNVSVEYLLTGSTPEKSYNYDITEFEYQIILAFRKEKAMQNSVLRLLGIEKNVESMSLEQGG